MGKGKVLVNEHTVESYGIQDNDVLVAMATKPKPQKLAESKLASPATTSSVAPVPEVTAPEQESACSSAEETVKQLCDMGFEREQVQKCLHAAFRNADRAIEYLMTGIPDSVVVPAGESAPAAPGQAQGPAGTTPFPAMPTLITNSGPAPGAFDELRSHPQFAELAQMVTHCPWRFQHILPELAQTYPHVVDEIRNYPGEFMRFLQVASGGQQAGDDGSDDIPSLGMPAAPGGQAVVQPSREEAEAIDRLGQLGFDRSKVVEAYFACGKNEELAANYLLEHMVD